MEINTVKKDQDATVSLNGRVSFHIWKCTMDTHRDAGKKIDGCFTRLLRSALGFTWRDHLSNKEIYAEVPKATDTIKL